MTCYKKDDVASCEIKCPPHSSWNGDNCVCDGNNIEFSNNSNMKCIWSEDDKIYVPNGSCMEGEKILNGRCYCGNVECSTIDDKNNFCVDNKCITCKDNENYNYNLKKCMCGDNECSSDSECQLINENPVCITCPYNEYFNSETKTCFCGKNPSCGFFETCDKNKCICGNRECQKDEICNLGKDGIAGCFKICTDKSVYDPKTKLCMCEKLKKSNFKHK